MQQLIWPVLLGMIVVGCALLLSSIILRWDVIRIERMAHARKRSTACLEGTEGSPSLLPGLGYRGAPLTALARKSPTIYICRAKSSVAIGMSWESHANVLNIRIMIIALEIRAEVPRR